MLRETLVASLSAHFESTATAATTYLSSRKEGTDQPRAITVTEQTDSVEVESLSGTWGEAANVLPTASPWPIPARAFKDAKAALREEDAEVIVQATPSGVPLLRAADYVGRMDDNMFVRPAGLVLKAGEELMSELGRFLPQRTEVERVRLAMKSKPQSIVADVLLSPLGALALANWRAQSALVANRPVLSRQPPTPIWGGDQDLQPCSDTRLLPHLTNWDIFWGLLQAPFLLTESVTPHLAEACRDPQSLARILGANLGIREVKLDATQDGALAIAAQPEGFPRKLHARGEAESPSRLRVVIGADALGIALSRKRADGVRQPAIAETPDEAQTTGVLCLEDGFHHVQRLLAEFGWHEDRFEEAPFEENPAVVTRELVAAELAFACAANFPKTHDAGQEWGEAVSLLAADLAHGEFALVKQLGELRRACQKGYGRACAQIPRIERLAGILLPRTRSPCGNGIQNYGPKDHYWLTGAIWSPAIVRGMVRDGTVESKADADIPASSYPAYDGPNMLAIDARTDVKHVQAYLERRGDEDVRLQHLGKNGWLEGVAKDEGGKIVVLPRVYAAPQKMDCHRRLLAYRFVGGGAPFPRSVVDLTRDCQFAEDAHLSTDVLLEFPEGVSWGAVVDSICRIVCEGEREKNALGPRNQTLYLGRRPSR